MHLTKEHILNEIRRVASLSGKTPTIKEFYRQTRIHDRHFRGVFWVRWTDAVIAAGLTPNYQPTAYDETALLDHCAKHALTLGRLPISRDFPVPMNQGPAAPRWNSIARRFRGKRRLIEKLREHCATRPHFEPVLRMCGPAPAFPQPPLPDPAKPKPPGFVYLMKSCGYYKIGRSCDLIRRQRRIGIQLPERPECVHEIYTDDPDGIELYWHRRFEHRRKNGEWFDLTDEHVGWFKKNNTM